MWTPERPISELPLELKESFIIEAQDMLLRLKQEKLEVKLIPAPEPRHVDHKIHIVVNQNPEWYRTLYQSKSNIKRKFVQGALERIANEQDQVWQPNKYHYDPMIREVILDILIDRHYRAPEWVPVTICDYV